MGYSYEMFADISRLQLPKRGRVLDLGSQDLTIGAIDQLREINRFISSFEGSPLPESASGTMIQAGEVWRRAGFDYR
jgi:hypothetical protein